MFESFYLYLFFALILLSISIVLGWTAYTGLVIVQTEGLIFIISLACIVFCFCVYSLLIYGRKYYINEKGITAVWLGIIKKEHLWFHSPVIYVCDLEMQKEHKYSLKCFVAFYDSSTPTTAKRWTESWNFFHPRKSAYFYYDPAIEAQLNTLFPQIRIEKIISDRSTWRDLNPLTKHNRR